MFWHWPDRVISKRESRRLREEHNALGNKTCLLQEGVERIKAILLETERPTSNRIGAALYEIELLEDGQRKPDPHNHPRATSEESSTLTQERAQKLWEARGPYDMIPWDQMTRQELQAIHNVWDTMPGNTSQRDAFDRIRLGKV